MIKKFIFVFVVLLLQTNIAIAKELVIKDVLGRTITLEKPVTKIILGEGRYLTTLALLDKENPVKRVVGMLNPLSHTNPVLEKKLKNKFPAYNKIQYFGLQNAGSVSAEKIITLQPDLAIFGIQDHGPGAKNKELITQLEKAGIKIIFIDFRLNVVPIECTPLRERLNDLPILADHFLKNICDGINKEKLELTKANIESLKLYSWPGNARELQNVLERAAILAVNGKLRFDLPNQIELKQPEPSGQNTSNDQEVLTLKEMQNFEKSNIQRALLQCDGRVSGKKGAAEKLGMRPTTLYSRLKAMKININDLSKTMSE